MIGQNLWAKFQPAREMSFYDEYNKALQTQKPVHFEEYYPPVERWFSVNAYPTSFGLSVFFQDITEKKAAEERLKASNERFEKMTEATNDAIWDWNIKENTLFWGQDLKSRLDMTCK
ncbi:MAG: hypothetical protein U5L96_07765 [Owenweeksia sp.]|nr:hypothetical protein [Owenweeksia sp.]